MAKRPSITTITTSYGSQEALNNNFESIESAFDNTLSRDGSTPNTMGADLDMNSNDILNANEINTTSLKVNGANLVSSTAIPDWKGAWVTSTDYIISDSVSYNGSSYICVENHTSGTFSIDLSSVKWELLAAKGDQGDQGIQGEVGPAGPTGPAGAGSGDMLAASNLSDVADAPTSLANLGVEEVMITDTTVLSSAFTNGGRYKLATDLSVSSAYTFSGSDSKHLIIDFNGHTITSSNASAVPILTIQNAVKASPVAVTAVSSTTADWSQGASQTTAVTVLTAAGHAFSVNDVIKVFDDTLLPHQHNSLERIGEFAIVGAVSGNDITLTKALVETYDTGSNMRVCAPSDSKVILKDLSLASTSTVTGNSGIKLSGFKSPSLTNISTKNLKGPGVIVESCYFPKVSGYYMDYHENGIEDGVGTNSFGYGILDKGSFGGTYRGLTGHKGRHLFDTGQSQSTAADDDPFTRGRTMFAQVSDSVGTSFSASVFSTHPSSLHVSFNNCVGNNAYRGYSSGGSAFVIRNPTTTLNNCKDINSRYGINVENYADETFDHSVSINNHTSENPEACFLFTGESGGVANVLVNNHNAIGLTSDYVVESTTYSNVKFKDCSVHFGSGALSSSEVFDIASNNTFVVRDMSIDLSDSSQTNHRLGQCSGAGNSIKGNFDIYQGGTDRMNNYFDATTNNITMHLEVEKDTSDTLIVSNQGASSDVRVIARNYGSVSDDFSRLRFITYASGGTQTYDAGDAADPEIFLRVTVSGAATTINSLPDGKDPGQIFTIINRDTSANNLVVDDQVGPSVALAAGEYIRLLWDNTQWRTIG